MKIYLAARYSRREELACYREELRDLGHIVKSRWLDGNHQLSNIGLPIGEDGESLVEDGDNAKAAELRAKFARDDFEDVSDAEMVISFTEEPRSKHGRGGRHVEFGIALANGVECIVIGHRENIFHWLPKVKFFADWKDAKAHIGDKKANLIALQTIARQELDSAHQA